MRDSYLIRLVIYRLNQRMKKPVWRLMPHHLKLMKLGRMKDESM